MKSKLPFRWKALAGVELIFGWLNTIRFNFRYFPIKIAIRFPVWVSNNVKLEVLHGNVEIQGEVKTGMIRLGFGAYSLFDHTREKAIFVNSSGGNLIFEGKAVLGPGFRVINNGLLTIGTNFTITGRSMIICENQITFGKDDLLSWDILIMDTDFHHVIIEGKRKSKTAPIEIGDKVWIGARATVLKGSTIPNSSVIGSATVISGQKNDEEGLVICGMSARVTRRGVDWER